MRRLFTTQEVMEHSVSGKTGNSKLPAKPKFDSARKSLSMETHNDATTLSMTSKIQAVQKAVRRVSSS